MYNNIPEELRSLRQWVAVGPNKEPLNPRTCRNADVNNPDTWGTFEEAQGVTKLIGFVLTANDPYCFIDLDAPQTPEQEARHQLIYDMFPSYTELSQSGKGVHIICLAHVPNGARRDKVEVYSSSRYMIMTGNVLRDLPIVDMQEVVDRLYTEMGGSRTASDLTERDATLTDEAVLLMATSATNADKFNALWDGEWADNWPSQSEADFALLAMLAFYTKSNEQVRTLFRRSALGQRAKAQRDAYLNTCLRKIRAHEVPDVDVSELKPTVVEEPEDTPPVRVPLQFPPGIVGEVAEFVLAHSTRPVPEVALAAAVGLVAGIVGRSYNISGMGLQQYLILLANTGSGKEGLASGIDKLISAVKKTVPMADTFIGPGLFASGQALYRVLEANPCFVSVLGEFGLFLEQLCDQRANSGEKLLKKLLLDLYGKSGATGVLRPNVYSDSQKNTKVVQSPNVTIVGESTPETFYRVLTQSHIAEGLVPRFLVLEYTGGRPRRNKASGIEPDESLVNKLADLAELALRTAQNNTTATVVLDTEATEALDAFDEEADNQIDAGANEVERHIWNRAHLKALKLAGLVAVGVAPHQPTVDLEIAKWAIQLVREDVINMRTRFSTGDVGTGEQKQEADLRRVFTAYLSFDVHKREPYNIPTKIIELPVVPYHYLRRRCRLLASFKEDRRGAGVALKALLDDLVRDGSLKLVSRDIAVKKYDVSAPLYVLGPNF